MHSCLSEDFLISAHMIKDEALERNFYFYNRFPHIFSGNIRTLKDYCNKIFKAFRFVNSLRNNHELLYKAEVLAVMAVETAGRDGPCQAVSPPGTFTTICITDLCWTPYLDSLFNSPSSGLSAKINLRFSAPLQTHRRTEMTRIKNSAQSIYLMKAALKTRG